ncbi:MAG: hypothetical protein ACKO3K_09710 [Cuspidothrix sp.]
MIFKSKPQYKDIALSVIATLALLGLLALAFTDNDSRKTFESMATLTIGAAVGYFIPGNK